VVEEGGVENVATSPLDMIGQVDAVMTVFRHGGLHAEYTLPFIKEGIPCWVDKPFTVSAEEAKRLVDEADKRGTLLTGGSTDKYAYDVLLLKNAVETESAGKVISGMINYPVLLDSEYAGFHFYGPHLVEMTQQIFGYDIQSVKATRQEENAIVIARYDKYDIVLNFNGVFAQNHGIIIGDKKNIVREIDTSLVLRSGFDQFANMLKTGKVPFDPYLLVKTTIASNAMEKAILTGEEVNISDIG
jgi:predicted dehydrogenase